MKISKLTTIILDSLIDCFEDNAKGHEEANQVLFPKPL
jgi:hypothetical protein